MASLSKLYSCDEDGVCKVCKEKPSPNDVISCNSCASACHTSCLPVGFYASAPISSSWLCADCSLARHLADRTVRDSDKILICSFCLRLPEQPVTTPCGHNFCLACFKKWIESGNQNCANCGGEIPTKTARQPRINTQLASAIRTWKSSEFGDSTTTTVYDHYMKNKEEARKRIEMACSGRICVRVSDDHFGPILARNDPVRKLGVAVGDTWKDRMGCRQWGIHIPIVGGVAGKSTCGAQSVALNGGFEDGEDHGLWFLLTGSERTDQLGGNKAGTSKDNDTSFDQKFLEANEALRISCLEGYPVRIVRTHKEKRSSYAPEIGIRYDGIYRIEKCWRIYGIQGHKVCRFLFVRCDNEPAPWASDENGDRPRPLPEIKELKDAMDLTERPKGAASWDYDEKKERWMWKKPPPHKEIDDDIDDEFRREEFAKRLKLAFIKYSLLREYGCSLCKMVLNYPVTTTPCAHNFCEECLIKFLSESHFMRCPSCAHDITHFLHNDFEVNEELMKMIELLQRELVELEESCSRDDEAFKLNLNVRPASEYVEDGRSNNSATTTNESVICTLNRQQTFDEFLAEEEKEKEKEKDDNNENKRQQQ